MVYSLSQLLGWKRTFRRLFSSRDGEIFLSWMSRQCYANRTTWEGDREAALVAEGRRQVWIKLRELLDLSEERIAELMKQEENDSE